MTNPCQNFNQKLLTGLWDYQAAFVTLSDGTVTNNFGPTPKGRFVIMKNGTFIHFVTNPALAPVSSGILQVLTDDEAQALAKGSLSHFGTWTAQPADGTFTLTIDKSSFPNFDGIEQLRIIQQLDETTLTYINTAVSNGQGATVTATLTRIASAEDDFHEHGHH